MRLSSRAQLIELRSPCDRDVVSTFQSPDCGLITASCVNPSVSAWNATTFPSCDATLFIATWGPPNSSPRHSVSNSADDAARCPMKYPALMIATATSDLTVTRCHENRDARPTLSRTPPATSACAGTKLDDASAEAKAAAFANRSAGSFCNA